MYPVYQDEIGQTGNCLSACFATLLDLRIDDVPNFNAPVDGSVPSSELYWKRVRTWLATQGFGLITVTCDSDYIKLVKGYMIVTGNSPRDPEMYHAVIYKDGEMIHDPYLEGGGLSEIKMIDILYPLDPSDILFCNKEGVKYNG